jgi:hypothetical protein
MESDQASAGIPTDHRDLPTTFSSAQARAAGFSRRGTARLLADDLVESIGWGMYRWTDTPPADLDLIAIAVRAPRATLCLATALVHHGLSDAIPDAPDVALPRGQRKPATAIRVRWHSFDPSTFDLGRGSLTLDDEVSIGLYTAQRSIIDAFRTRGTEGHEQANDALRRWLRQPGSQPGQLLQLARRFPRATTPLQAALEVLL